MNIVKPILVQEKADFNQIECLFTGDHSAPAVISRNDIYIKCCHITHFNGWDLPVKVVLPSDVKYLSHLSTVSLLLFFILRLA